MGLQPTQIAFTILSLIDSNRMGPKQCVKRPVSFPKKSYYRCLPLLKTRDCGPPFTWDIPGNISVLVLKTEAWV